MLAFTPTVFVFLTIAHQGIHFAEIKILDTAIAAGIALGPDLLRWLRAPSLRPQLQVRLAVEAADSFDRRHLALIAYDNKSAKRLTAALGNRGHFVLSA